MIETISRINSAVNGFIWGVPAMIALMGAGIYLSIRLKFMQVTKFAYIMKTTVGRIFKKRNVADGALSPFQAATTALAATVGTGNIAGKYSGCCRCNIHRRTGKCILDVDFGNIRYVYQVYRGYTCSILQKEKQERRTGRRTYVLHK